MPRITATFLSILLISIGAQGNDKSVAFKEWQSYIKSLEPMGERVVELMLTPDDPQLRQEVYKHLYSLIAQGYFGLVYADAEHPDFWPFLNPVFNTLGPNPDDTYYMTPLDGDGVYKISGYRGVVRILDFAIGSGTVFTRGYGHIGPTLANYNADDLDKEKG